MLMAMEQKSVESKAKNPTKAKNSKATLLRVDPEAKPFLTPEARLALTQLRQAFTEAPF